MTLRVTLDRTLEKKVTGIENYLFDGGKITELKLRSENEVYVFQIGEEKIKSFKEGSSRKLIQIADYDFSEGDFTWYLDHCCGAHGFGFAEKSYCPGCENKIVLEEGIDYKKIISATKNEKIARDHHKYLIDFSFDDFSNLIRKEIPKYCFALEEVIKNLGVFDGTKN